MNSFTFILVEHPVIVLFLLINLVLGIWVHSKASIRTFHDYALASRCLPLGIMAVSLLAARIGNEELTEPGRIFDAGMVQMLMSIAFVVGFLVTGSFIAPKLVHFRTCMTSGDMMKLFYGGPAQMMTGMVTFIVSILIISSQIEAIGNISYLLLGISPTKTILFFGIFTLMYSTWGGVRSVSYTNILQITISFVVFGYLVHSLVQTVGDVHFWQRISYEKVFFLRHPNLRYHLKGALFYNILPVFMLTPPIVQRMLMVQGKHQVKKIWYISVFLYCVILFMITAIGLVAFMEKDKLGIHNSVNILPVLINFLFKGNGWFIDFMFIGLLGILLSTMNSYLHAAGVLVTQDIIAPLYLYFFNKPLDEFKKVPCARLGMVVTGLLSVVISLLGQAQLHNWQQHENIVIFLSIVLLPLLLGIIGLKTDRSSFFAFIITYLSSISVLHWYEWNRYDSFFFSIISGLMTYLIAHFFKNGAFIIITRSENTFSVHAWPPSFHRIIKNLTKSIVSCFHSVSIKRKQLIKYPDRSLVFSILILSLYTLSSMSIIKGENANKVLTLTTMICIVGIILCCGLLVKGIWPVSLRPYFSSYWLFTLFFCMPFSGTLALLCLYKSGWTIAHWACGLVLFACFVELRSFATLGFLGMSLALVVCKLVFGTIPYDLIEDENIVTVLTLVILTVGILLCLHKRDTYVRENLYLSRIASGDFAHEMRHSLQMLGGTGLVLENAFSEGVTMRNMQGEEGFWIPKRRHIFLNEFASVMVEKSQEVTKDLDRFTRFIEQQAFSSSREEKVSVRQIVTEGIEKISKQYNGKVEVKMSCEKDFQANLLASLFPAVITNLVTSAYLHGKASLVTINVDGDRNIISVRDNGNGVSPQTMSSIFDTNNSQPLNEGLYFAKTAIEASDGHFSCHSGYGLEETFTEFLIRLP